MSERPPIQSKFSFGEEGEVEIVIPKETIFKVGDRVRVNSESPDVSKIYEVDSIHWEWGEPLYIISRIKGKEFFSTFCTAEEMIKVE